MGTAEYIRKQRMDGEPRTGKPAPHQCLDIHVDYICCVQVLLSISTILLVGIWVGKRASNDSGHDSGAN